MPSKNKFLAHGCRGGRAIQRTRMLAAWVCAALAIAMAASAGASAATRNAGAANAAPAMVTPRGGGPFAIADFDGDHRPDLARVQAGQSSSYETQYWIQLQLTQAGRQLIGIVAPAGGLRVTASDVNGDHAIDLVLSTTWLGRPVAVLLNNGHGQFTPEKPSAYPGAFQQAASEGLSHARHPRATASAAQSRPSVDVGGGAAQPAPRARNRIYLHSAVLLSTSHLLTHGRAPPSLL